MTEVLHLCRLNDLDTAGSDEHIIVYVTATNETPELRLDVCGGRAVRKYLELDATGAHQTYSAKRVGQEGAHDDATLEQLPDFRHPHVPPARAWNIPVEGLERRVRIRRSEEITRTQENGRWSSKSPRTRDVQRVGAHGLGSGGLSLTDLDFEQVRFARGSPKPETDQGRENAFDDVLQ